MNYLSASTESTGEWVQVEEVGGVLIALLLPDEADELAAELQSQAAAIRARDTDNDRTTDVLRGV